MLVIRARMKCKGTTGREQEDGDAKGCYRNGKVDP